MARSSYVYLVMKGELPLGAFTVKYEMCDWLARNILLEPDVADVYRMPGEGGRGALLEWQRQEDGKVFCS